MTMTYRPPFLTQIDGTACQWDNCGCASTAMAANRDHKGVDPRTAGPWPPASAAVRKAISPTHCGGTSHEQGAAAAKSLYATTLLIRYRIPWDSFRSLIVSGRGARVSILYAVIAPTEFDASPGFVGTHAIYVNERRASDGAYLVSDPLANGRRRGIPKGPQWWPGSLLKRATGAYPGCGYGFVTASYTRDTEA